MGVPRCTVAIYSLNTLFFPPFVQMAFVQGPIGAYYDRNGFMPGNAGTL